MVAPGLAHDVTEKVVATLASDLRRSFGSVSWRTELVVDRLVVPPAPTPDIVEAARRLLLNRNWDVAVVVTDLPVRIGRRTVATHISPTHGVALVSLPALGALHLRQRLHRTLLRLVGQLVGKADEGTVDGGRLVARVRRSWTRQALRQLAAEEPRRSPFDLLLLPAEMAGYLRLLIGMVRANRPWQLAGRLYGALIAALGAGVYGLVTADIWRLWATMTVWRLVVLTVLAVTATVIAVIAVHGLWERAPDPRVRAQIVLFNLTTAVTITVGFATLYLVLFVIVLLGAELLITPHTLARVIERPVGTDDYVLLSWFVTSLAMVVGALGAGLESDEAVRSAAYAVSESEARESQQLAEVGGHRTPS